MYTERGYKIYSEIGMFLIDWLISGTIDITLDNDGDLVLDTEFVPVVGDIIRINEKEYRLTDIDGVVTLERGDEIQIGRASCRERVSSPV